MDAGTSTCFIDDLPDELLVGIVSHLQVERGFLADAEAEDIRRCKNAVVVRSLHALVLCSRRLNAIATPFLYQCIIRTNQLVTLLLRSLLQNPDLGQHIRYFEATSFEYYDLELYPFDFEQGLTEPTRKQYFQRRNNVAWIVPKQGSVADCAFRAGQTVLGFKPTMISVATLDRIQKQISLSQHGILVVLLSLTDNLQDVAIGTAGSMGSLANLAFLRFFRPGVLRRLWIRTEDEQCNGYRLLYMCSDAEDKVGSLAHYLRSVLLPEPMWSEFGPPSAMEEVSLTMQDASTALIHQHLRGCASLKAFSCRWQWTNRFIPQHPVELPRLYRLLERFQDTLTRLAIDTTESAWRVELDTYIPALGSLRSFKVLTYLEIAALALWGDGDFWEPAPLSQLLPESLESLNLKSEWDEDIEDKLYQLSSECATSLPKLKKVECTWRPAPGFIADLLVDACRSAGIYLVLDVEQPGTPG